MLQLQFLNIAKPPMWLVESNYSIGSAADSNCVLQQPGVMPHHAKLLVDGESVVLLPLSSHTLVNGILAAGRTPISHGDTLEIGSVIISLVDPKITRRAPEKFASAEPQPWQLQPMSTVLDPKVFNLMGAMTIGRSKECEICLNFAHLSRRHATLTVLPTGLEIEDLGSSNGTYVNGNKIRRVLLRNGDILSFDTIRFRILGPEEDTDKTALRPGIQQEELNPTHLLQRPASSDAFRPNQRPQPSAQVRPSSAQASAAIRRSRLLLLTGISVVALLFSALILFLLH